MKAKIKTIDIPWDKRLICISDIHGRLDLFKRLLEKVGYSGGDDILVLLGDLYTKFKEEEGHATLKFIIELSKSPNVHVLRGNCDWIEDYFSEDEKDWVEGLPHIIESRDFIFVHGGLTSNDLTEQSARACMKNDNFMEQGLCFDKYVIAGHWPTVSYTHKIPCFNPIIDEKSRIISIDGGHINIASGQLNAFIVSKGGFSFECVDDFPTVKVEKAQAAKGGKLNITWLDRFIELEEDGKIFATYRHLKTGSLISIPKSTVWTDGEGNICSGSYSTDYYLPVEAGDTVSVVNTFGDRMFAKIKGIAGWIEL